MSGEWFEQSLAAEQLEWNRLYLVAHPEVTSGRDRWGPGASHTAPVFGDQWLDRKTGRAWVYRRA